jgi:predicted phosphodiesterase
VQVAALYDVHGNLPALEAVLADIPEGTPILVGGDVAAGPWPSETLERLRALGDRVHWIRGNADREVWQDTRGMAPPEMIDFVRARLSDEQLDFLRPQPLTEMFAVDGLGRVLFCHATPRNDEEILTRISPDDRWAVALAGVEADVVVCGHTHVQFERLVGDVRLVNAGSVGMPYESEPGAYWALLGPDVELRWTPYESGDVASTGWPLEMPSAGPEEATELFERMSRERAEA